MIPARGLTSRKPHPQNGWTAGTSGTAQADTTVYGRHQDQANRGRGCSQVCIAVAGPERPLSRTLCSFHSSLGSSSWIVLFRGVRLAWAPSCPQLQ